MAKQYFVMGIGGTGMRCIESLIHLCAMGMFDDTEIHLLALDTDKNNGNFSRLKEVKEAYVNAKNLDKANRTSLTDTFFSADINIMSSALTTKRRVPSMMSLTMVIPSIIIQRRQTWQIWFLQIM